MELVLNAAIREGTGKGAAYRLRQQGTLPAVLYGNAQENLSLNLREVRKYFSTQGTNQLLMLRLTRGNKTEDLPVLVKEIQYDPVKRTPLHLDLYQVSMEQEVNVNVPVVLVGEEEREDDGSVVDQIHYRLEVSCLPAEIPAKIEVDVSKLTVNEAITIADLELPSGVKFTADSNEPVVVATIPKMEIDEDEEEADEEVELTEETEGAAAPETTEAE
jgi:large subunit ribosomal protein L25